ncbi:Spx/MgsR family RNA polymerase-binding regulatory protein, partial [Streptococcus pluranimalium]
NYRSVDIKTNPPKVSLLKELLENSDLDLKKFFNTSGNSYRELGLKDKFDSLTVDEALELLSKDGMLIKRPILIEDDKVLQIGYRTPYAELDL